MDTKTYVSSSDVGTDIPYISKSSSNNMRVLYDCCLREKTPVEKNETRK